MNCTVVVGCLVSWLARWLVGWLVSWLVMPLEFWQFMPEDQYEIDFFGKCWFFFLGGGGETNDEQVRSKNITIATI